MLFIVIFFWGRDTGSDAGFRSWVWSHRGHALHEASRGLTGSHDRRS